jgi:hypothetical protein
MTLPYNNLVSTHNISSIFNKTTATYKFYWFLSLLEIYSEKRDSKIPIRNILSKMICNAWYPIHYFMLSFGFADILSRNSKEIQKIGKIPADISKQDLYHWLINNDDKRIIKLIDHFDKQVPYRFLSPWLPGLSDKDIVSLSQQFTNNCLYRINKADKSIELNPQWTDYLFNNRGVLEDFCYWNLSLYLQSKNPNTPDIPNKLIKPTGRGTLIKQRKFWEIVFHTTPEISCIYTGRQLTTDDFAVEHFIPHSFVSHDLLWNLVPADRSINCSKSNKLPDLNLFIDKFAQIQKTAVSAVYYSKPEHKMLEDYLILGGNIPDLLYLPDLEFTSRYYDILSPLTQIAKNMGFESWQYNS